MKFGVFYEHQLPRPWTTTSEYDLLAQSLDQFQLADQLGYDYAWVVDITSLRSTRTHQRLKCSLVRRVSAPRASGSATA